MTYEVCRRLSITAVVLAAGSAACADPGLPPVPVPVPAGAAIDAVPTRAAAERFIIEDCSALVSRAWRVNDDRADAGGAVEAMPGYLVTNRVIVETDNPGALRMMAGQRRAGAANGAVRASAVRGFSFVETANAGDAVELAAALRATGLFTSVEVDIERPRTLRGVLPNDPLFSNQWHLLNTSNTIADINAEAAWAAGYTGAGVTIGVTEGGFQSSHPDLAPHYVTEASQGSGNSSHATSVAGVFGAVGDNGIGVSGLAYNCGISQQLLGGAAQNAAAFTFRNDLNDIKNDSWGPFDSGDFWDEYASSIELAALQDCAMLGRGGLGTMTCWAAGNGGSQDRVDYDPYTSSRYTFAIGAIGDQDREASYNETGSSMLVVAHSSGNNRSITSTTTGSGYTNFFGGTSSASPLAAGAVGLALEANPALTWRDMQALLAETARKCDPADFGWETNAAGKDINYRFGFGAIDAGALVSAAETWEMLPPEESATSGLVEVNAALPDNNPTGETRTVEIIEDLVIEQVVLNMNVTTPFVGDLRVSITSPAGTNSIFMVPRSFDPSDDIDGFDFLSMRCWGESSAGTWSVKVSDERPSNAAFWTDYTLTVYGTAEAAGCNPADLAEPFGVLDLADVQAFVAAFLAGDPAADLATPEGVFDLSDVQAFVSGFSSGCP